MKISQISKFVSLLLIIVMIGFGGTVSWSLNHLNKAFGMVEFFGQQKDKIFSEINQPIFSYLYSGEAMLLTDIGRNLIQLKTGIEANGSLSEAVKNSLLQMLSEVQQSALPELTAAGKLADPQVLLINNEKQLSAHLQTLLNYAEKAGGAAAGDKLAYLQAIGQTQAALQNLSRVRQSFFSSRKQVAPDALQHNLQQLTAAAAALEHLPLLGVMKVQAGDDPAFTLSHAASEKQAEDMALEPLAEIRTLLNRYQKDLGSAQDLVKQKLASQNNINRQIQVFQEKLLALENEITGEYQHYEWMLNAIITACILLIAAMSVLMLVINRHLAAFIRQISSYIDKLANGDLSSAFTLNSRIAEINQLQISLKKLYEYFNLLICNINRESSALKRFGGNIEDVAQNLKNIIADQQQATEAAAAQMQELSRSFKDVAENAAESQNNTTSSQSLIEQGVQHMNHTSSEVAALEQVINETAEALQLLRQDAVAIEGVLGMIQGFAEQTNLLALNAAIEAARAGEHGRGFAVVADEVRRLAANTASSAGQIQALVEKLGKATNTTVALMNNQQMAASRTTQAVQQVNDAFGGIKLSINRIYEKSSQITEAALQQLQMTEQLASNFEQTAALAQQTTVAAQTNMESAFSLTDVSENLHQLVAQFKLTAD